MKLAEQGLLPVESQKMVLLVHGGPKARDFFGFSPMNAWLTNRGYAVMQVCFLNIEYLANRFFVN